jgi:hypothetical protein
LHRQLAAGVADPKVIPHPEDIDFNPATGEVEIMGPTNEEEYQAVMAVKDYLDYVNKIYEDAESKGLHDKYAKKLYLKRVDQLNSVLPKRLRRPALK